MQKLVFLSAAVFSSVVALERKETEPSAENNAPNPERDDARNDGGAQ